MARSSNLSFTTITTKQQQNVLKRLKMTFKRLYKLLGWFTKTQTKHRLHYDKRGLLIYPYLGDVNLNLHVLPGHHPARTTGCVHKQPKERLQRAQQHRGCLEYNTDHTGRYVIHVDQRSREEKSYLRQNNTGYTSMKKTAQGQGRKDIFQSAKLPVFCPQR